MRLLAALLLALAVCACGPRPMTAEPALWQVDGPLGRKAWLFGTIHALDAPTLWRSQKVGAALDEADAIVVEVADLENAAAMQHTFAQLARTPGQPLLTGRVNREAADGLRKMMARQGLDNGDFADVESWAAALMLAQGAGSRLEARYGVDRAVLREAARKSKRVFELEGAQHQLEIFDRLPPGDQRALLEAVITDASSLTSDSMSLAKAWRAGDVEAIAREASRGLLAEPGLRAQLFTQRNRAWVQRIGELTAAGSRPFIAVGAAHITGQDGLIALLEERGFTVKRIQ